MKPNVVAWTFTLLATSCLSAAHARPDPEWINYTSDDLVTAIP